MSTRVSKPFVRIAPTVLFLAPPCYGQHTESCDNRAAQCPVRDECISGVKIEMKEVGVASETEAVRLPFTLG